MHLHYCPACNQRTPTVKSNWAWPICDICGCRQEMEDE